MKIDSVKQSDTLPIALVRLYLHHLSMCANLVPSMHVCVCGGGLQVCMKNNHTHTHSSLIINSLQWKFVMFCPDYPLSNYLASWPSTQGIFNTGFQGWFFPLYLGKLLMPTSIVFILRSDNHVAMSRWGGHGRSSVWVIGYREVYCLQRVYK